MTDFNEAEQAALDHATMMAWEYVSSLGRYDMAQWSQEEANELPKVIVQNYLLHLAWQKQQSALNLASNSLEKANSVPGV
jgi:hypothetical protein